MPAARRSTLPAACIRQIKIAQKRLGMDDSDYRAMLLRVVGVHSCTELDGDKFAAVMAEFGRMGFESTANRERRMEAQRIGTHATYQQRKKIQAMWNKWQGREDEEGLNRWLEKKFHCAHLRFLARDTAAKVICALGHFKSRDETN